MKKSILMTSVAAIGALAFCGGAYAQSEETMVVTGDAAGLIELKPSTTAMGLPLSLIETPRAATIISDTTISRYGINNVNSLTAITPGAYTASFYGVGGAVNLRGTLAETYFRGFKRVENRGTFTTPLGDAAQIEILRGPPSPIYGAGKVGGLLNFIPKTARGDAGYLTEVTGQATVTYGSWEKRNFTGQVGIPVNLGFATGGVYVFGEIDDSYSYYRGIHPSRQMLETSADFDFGDGWSFASDYMYYHSNGDVQTPGWNRLTQDLIDNQNYQAGRDTSLADADGNGRLTINEFGGNRYFFQGQALYQIAFRSGNSVGCSPNFNCIDTWHTLDTGVGIKKLDPRTVYIAKGVDFSNTFTHTAYMQFGKDAGEYGKAKLELFYDQLNNDRFVSYGFPASYRSQIYEARLSDSFDWDGFGGLLKTSTVAGFSYRYTHGMGRESFNSGVIALDRRDLTVGATANDIITSPFQNDPAPLIGMRWENDQRTNIGDAGLFLTSAISLYDLNVILGGRWDSYHVSSKDIGALSFQPTGLFTQNKDALTYTASVNYTTPWGIIPYATYAKNTAVEIGQAGQVSPSLLQTKAGISNSFLTEGGVKWSLFEDHLVGALSFYRQERTRVSNNIGVVTVVGTRSTGTEIEIRWVADENWSFTLAGNMQHTMVKGPDASFVYLPARTAGVSPVNGFGGSYVSFNFATFPGPNTNYEYRLIPHAVFSPYVTYTSDEFEFGKLGATAGFSAVTSTAQLVPNPIVFPSYTVANLSLFWQYESWEVNLNITNLADELYFTPDADSYANLGALPSIGRGFQITLKKSF
jgi:iron complex outermembrane receptor protein